MSLQQCHEHRHLFFSLGSYKKGSWFHIIFFTPLVLPPLLRDPVRTKQKTSLPWSAYESTSLLGCRKACQCGKREFRAPSEACPGEVSSVNHIWQPFVRGLFQLTLCPSVWALVYNPTHHTHHSHWDLCWMFTWWFCWLKSTDSSNADSPGDGLHFLQIILKASEVFSLDLLCIDDIIVKELADTSSTKERREVRMALLSSPYSPYLLREIK